MEREEPTKGIDSTKASAQTSSKPFSTPDEEKLPSYLKETVFGASKCKPISKQLVGRKEKATIDYDRLQRDFIKPYRSCRRVVLFAPKKRFEDPSRKRRRSLDTNNQSSSKSGPSGADSIVGETLGSFFSSIKAPLRRLCFMEIAELAPHAEVFVVVPDSFKDNDSLVGFARDETKTPWGVFLNEGAAVKATIADCQVVSAPLSNARHTPDVQLLSDTSRVQLKFARTVVSLHLHLFRRTDPDHNLQLWTESDAPKDYFDRYLARAPSGHCRILAIASLLQEGEGDRASCEDILHAYQHLEHQQVTTRATKLRTHIQVLQGIKSETKDLPKRCLVNV